LNRETREYNYAWMIWSILDHAAKLSDGSSKEYNDLLELVPHFEDVLDMFLKQGEAGELFLKLLAEYTASCLNAEKNGKKACLTSFSVATPILYAFDIVPVCLEAYTVLGTIIFKRGTSQFLDYCCELGFTETSCSAQRGALGAFLAGLAIRPDFVVCDSPGVCDSNANSFAFASAYLDIPFYQLNYPSTLTGKRAETYHRKDFRNLIRFLEEHTDTVLDQDRLAGIIHETKRQDELICELTEFNQLIPTPVPAIYDLMVYGGKTMMNGMKRFTELLESMVKKVTANALLSLSGSTSTREKARLLLCYIGHYTTDARFWDWMDRNDISLLGSILCTFWQEGASYAEGRSEEGYRIDDTSLDAMIDSLADQMSRMPMIKSIRGPYDAPDMWLEDSLGMARLLHADFIAYFSTVGCRNTWSSVKLLTRDLEQQGVPSLLLFVDAFDDRVASWESITGRIEEFIQLRGIMKQTRTRCSV